MPATPNHGCPSGAVPLLTALPVGLQGHGAPVPSSAWRKIEIDPRWALPQPPPDRDPVIVDLLKYAVERAEPEPWGYGRVVRRLRVWDVYPEGDGEPWEWAAQEPGLWDFEQIPEMHKAALEIAVEAGLSPLAPANWIFQDDCGAWWALEEKEPLLLADSGPMAWRLPLGAREWGAEVPRRFLDDMGGPNGPLAWALWTIDLVLGLREDEAHRAKRAAEIGKLTTFPEWSALERAVAASADPQALEGLRMLKADVTLQGLLAVRGSLDWGFRAGQELGFFAAADLVARHEAGRTAAVVKSELRTCLREIVVAEHKATGKVRSYILARTLIAEGDTTERSRRLKAAGMPAENRLGALISEEKKAAGLG